jgi:hypothetical protein
MARHWFAKESSPKAESYQARLPSIWKGPDAVGQHHCDGGDSAQALEAAIEPCDGARSIGSMTMDSDGFGHNKDRSQIRRRFGYRARSGVSIDARPLAKTISSTGTKKELVN